MAWPAAGAMSTHIIKPEPTDPHVPIRRIIEYEHWAMSLAAAAGIPAGEIGRPEDFGHVVTFLCSSHARYITGMALPVAGGMDKALL